MAFEVVKNIPEARPKWVPASYGAAASTFYVGQIVCAQMTGSAGAMPVSTGVVPMGAAAGANDLTDKKVPVGVVVGIGSRYPTTDSTYKALSEASVNTGALQLARTSQFVQGPYAKNDPRLFVQIIPIYPSTVLRAKIYESTYGTAPTVVTATAVNGTAGLGFTNAAQTPTPIANTCTYFCRSGLNQGLQRVAYDASATAHTFYVYWPRTLAIGDTFVRVPFREIGVSNAQIDAAGMFLDSHADYTTNCYTINVEKLNIADAGNESIEFTFNMDQFCFARA